MGTIVPTTPEDKYGVVINYFGKIEQQDIFIV